MKVAIYWFLVFCLFVTIFLLEFYFGLLRNLNLLFIKSLLGSDIKMVLNKNNIFSSVILATMLWSFLVTLPFADYLWRYRRSIVKKHPRPSWLGSLLMLLFFLLGLLAAYGKLYFKLILVSPYVDLPMKLIDMSVLQPYLLKSQWSFGFMFIALLIIIRKLKA